MNDSEQPNGGTGSGERSSDSGGPVSRRRRTRLKRFWRLVKWTFAVSFCFLLVLTGVLVKRYGHNKGTTDFIKNIPLGDLFRGTPLASYTPANYLPEYPHTLNLLILGCDRDYAGKMVNGVAVPVPILNTNGRSDAIMIAHYDFDKKTISLMTIPRDTAVHVPGHSTHKINAAHQFGGPELTKQTIKDAFGIDTDAYVSLHFEAFEKIVDTVGGVTINVKKQLDYDDNWALLHIHLKPGVQRLYGYQAMGYVRIRHSDSDLMRAERQHEFIEAFRDQIRTPAMLMKGADVLDAITDNLHMSPNLNTNKLIALANWSKSLPKESITLATMPSVEGPSYVTVNRKPARKMVAQIFFNGKEDAVTITAPDKAALYALNHKTSARKSRLHPHGTVDTGSDVPLDDPNPTPDTTDATANNSKSDKPDSSGPGTKSDGGATPDKKSNDSGDKGKDNPPPKDPSSAVMQLAILPFA